jgi:hypothetical protein
MAPVAQRIHSLKLPLSFDRAALQADVDAIPDGDWVEHYNRFDYEGDWRGVALRSADGTPNNLFAGNGTGAFQDTQVLSFCPYLQRVLRSFHFPLGAVRLLSLRAGSVILEHSDPALSYEDGEVRLHVPVRTNPELEFYLDGRRLALVEGETWYMNLSLPHRVNNRGASDRVHLVIDGKVNPWLEDLFSRGKSFGSAPREATPFELFREQVFADSELRDTLLAIPEWHLFISRAAELATARGFAVTERDVTQAIRAGSKAWHRRHDDI